MKRSTFQEFIFDDDILGEIPSFKKKNVKQTKVLFKSDLDNLIEPVESTMLSIPRSDILDSEIADELEDSREISESIKQKKPLIIDIHSFNAESEEEEDLSKELSNSLGTYDLTVDSSEKRQDTIFAIKAESLSLEDNKVISHNKAELSYDGKTGHYRTEKNGSVNEGSVEADDYRDFLKKIYEPLVGKLESDQSLSSEDTEVPSNELIVNIEH